MSNLLLISIKDNKALIRYDHYRRILFILDRNRALPRPFWLDSGWLLVDCDRQTMLSRQDAFARKDIRNPAFKEFRWMTL